jgi:multisubunit Na+/H+ antiporter MnhG subunit
MHLFIFCACFVIYSFMDSYTKYKAKIIKGAPAARGLFVGVVILNLTLELRPVHWGFQAASPKTR